MALKMNAAVVEQFGKPLLLREWDIPSPGAGRSLERRRFLSLRSARSDDSCQR